MQRVFCLLALLTALVTASRSGAGSLPVVPSGARPGPDVLYAPPPAAPQLENRDPHFTAEPILVSGHEAYVAGEYLYQDYLYDDFGSDTDGEGAFPLSPKVGDIDYPTELARYANNAADLVEFRIAAGPTEVAYRVTLNALLEPDSTIVAIVFDTDRNVLTGVATLPRDPGAPFPGTDEVIFLWGTGAEHIRFDVGGDVVTPLSPTVDLEANQITVVVPRTVSNPTGLWRTTVATGLYDPATGGWLFPQATADRTTPGGAGPLDPAPSAIFNLAFRFNEPVVGQDIPADANQAVALRNKTPTTFAHDIDFDALAAGAVSSTVPPSGIQIRMFPSRLDLGEGKKDVGEGSPDFGDPFPQYLGQLQPYALYVPTTYTPGVPAGLTLNMHSLGEFYWQYNGSTMNQQIGEARGNLVATPLARGPDGWYQHEGEYDVFEVWADVARHFTLDADRAASSGYSMGGYATYRLATLYPDLFGRAFTQVGPPAEGIWLPPAEPTGGNATLTNLWLENARNVPFLNIAAAQDELVPFPGPRAQNLGAPEHGINGFDQLGYRFRFLVVNASDHFAMAANGYDFPFATEFLGDARVERDPVHVTFAYMPATDDPALGLVHDHAYWVSGLTLADSTPVGSVPAKGVIDAFSHGFGLGDPPSMAGADAGFAGPFAYDEFNRSWGDPPAIPIENLLALRLTNLAAARIDLARAALDAGEVLRVAVDADADASIALEGAFAEGRVVMEDARILDVPEPDETGAVIPVRAGSRLYTITRSFELRRVRAVRREPGRDKLVLRGLLSVPITELGLPGADVTVRLAADGTVVFDATVPAALLVTNRLGTRVSFRARTGDATGGLTRLSIGGRRGKLAVRARDLDLTNAEAGIATASLQVGSVIEAAAGGTLRARGNRLLHP